MQQEAGSEDGSSACRLLEFVIYFWPSEAREQRHCGCLNCWIYPTDGRRITIPISFLSASSLFLSLFFFAHSMHPGLLSSDYSFDNSLPATKPILLHQITFYFPERTSANSFVGMVFVPVSHIEGGMARVPSSSNKGVECLLD